MDRRYRFRIANSYRPDTLPMERLAEYMAAFARLLSEPKEVHFEKIEAGSAVLVADVDQPARPKVWERVRSVSSETAPKDAMKAFRDLDALLRADNAHGELLDERGAVVIPFPGIERAAPLVFGPFKQDGSLDGQVIRVGGKDATIPVHLRDGDVIHSGLNTTQEIAREIARHIFGQTIRVHGTGTWFRDGDGTWRLESFKIASFEVLDDAPLMAVVAAIRQVPGSTWNEVPDPVRALLEERHDGASN